MAKGKRESRSRGNKPLASGPAAKTAKKDEKDDCRCKEMAEKSPRELLKVAIDDLSFWKKKK